MKYNISNDRIILDELGEEYKELLVERLLSEMDEVDVDRINPADLMQLDISTKVNLRNGKQIQRRNRMFTMISILGILYAFSGLMFFILNEMEKNSNDLVFISISLIFIGLFISLTSLILRLTNKEFFKSTRKKASRVSPYEIIDKWKEVEALVTQLSPESDNLSLNTMIKNLKEANIINENDTIVIYRLMKARNEIVHKNERDYSLSQVELKDLASDADNVIDKMRKVL